MDFISGFSPDICTDWKTFPYSFDQNTLISVFFLFSSYLQNMQGKGRGGAWVKFDYSVARLIDFYEPEED